MIYLKSLRYLARDLTRAARQFAADYNTVGYEYAHVVADPSWDVIACRARYAAELRWDVGQAQKDLAWLDRDLPRWEDVS